MTRAFSLVVFAALLASGADKPVPSPRAENEDVAINVTLLNTKEAIKQEVGSDLDGYFILVSAKLTPKGGKPVAVSRDDFLLRSNKDGQKAFPFAPSQIAGRGALVVRQTGRGGGVGTDNPGGPVIGGWPGGGRPTRLPGQNQGVIGNAGDAGSAEAKVETTGKDKGENPLLTTLKQKVFPDKQTTEPVSGLLYFQLEGKHKPKDLELVYKGPGGKLTLPFRP